MMIINIVYSLYQKLCLQGTYHYLPEYIAIACGIRRFVEIKGLPSMIILVLAPPSSIAVVLAPKFRSVVAASIIKSFRKSIDFSNQGNHP